MINRLQGMKIVGSLAELAQLQKKQGDKYENVQNRKKGRKTLTLNDLSFGSSKKAKFIPSNPKGDK